MFDRYYVTGGTGFCKPPNDRRHKRQYHRTAVFTYSTGVEPVKAYGAMILQKAR